MCACRLCVLVDYVKGIYYARFYNPSYHRYRENSDKVNGA